MLSLDCQLRLSVLTYCDCQLHDVCVPLNWCSPKTPPSLLYSASAGVAGFSRCFTIGGATADDDEEEIGRKDA